MTAVIAYSVTTMGTRPRDPKPIRLLKNDKAHAHRYADLVEPEPVDARPQAPDYLSERAAEIFEDFVQRIEEMYPASETDLDIIVLYANNKEQLEYYENMLRIEGSTVKLYSKPNNEGEVFLISVRARPEIAMLRECKLLQFKILREFGLSPSSRSSVNLKPPAAKEQNPFGAMAKPKTMTA